MRKTVFLTGASGHLGQYVLPRLLDAGHRVYSLTRNPTRNIVSHDLVDCPGSFRDLNKYRSEIEQSDAIIHLASARSEDREVVMQQDIAGLLEFMDIWKNGNFIFASSQVVYGTPPHSVMDESTRLAPQSWYDLGKIISEYIIRANPYLLRKSKNEGEMHWQVLRIPLLIGQNDRASDRQFLYALCEHARKDYPFVFYASEQESELFGSSWLSGPLAADICLQSISINRSAILNVASGFMSWVPLLKQIIARLNSSSKILYERKGNTVDHAMVLPHSRSDLDCKTMTALLDVRERKVFDDYLTETLLSFDRRAAVI